MSFTIGSLFDGSGGFPLAATMCGGTPKWASEIEPYPIAVTKSRFPGIKHLGSVTDIKGGEVEPVDVITFGSPCQDLSVAGKRAGLKHTDNGDDETTRSGLFMEAVRIIKEMREATNGVYPRFALWENVPGAFSSNKGEDFRIVLEELIKVVEPTAVMPEVPKNGWPYADSYCGDGWSIAYRVLDAQFWGVPQRRRRIYLVADFRGECAGKVSFEREGLRGYFETGRTPWQTATGDAEGGSGAADCERDSVAYSINHQGGNVEQIIEDKVGTLTAAMNSSGNNKLSVAYPYTLKIRSGCEGGGKGALIQTDMSATLATNNDQYLFQPIGIVDSIGGQAERGWEGECSPCLKASHYKFAPVVAYPVENHPADSRVNIDDSGKVQTLTSRMGTGGGNVPMVMESHFDVEMEVATRKYDVDQEKLVTLLRSHKGTMSNREIAEKLGKPVTMVEHWFRMDKCFAVPDPDVWYPLKKLLGIETDEFDRCVTEFKGGNYDMRNRIYTGDVSPTLTCGCGNDLHLLPNAPVVFDGANVTSPVNASNPQPGDPCHTLSTDSRSILVEPVYCLQGNGIDRADTAGCNGKGWKEDTSYTLNTIDRPAVAYGTDVGFFNSLENQSPTLLARGYKDPHLISYSGNDVNYIVRRLTPTECARLQGFADWHGHLAQKPDLTDEEYSFWMEVRNTHAAINGKAVKDYTKDQILKWYNSLHTDSSEYKMWGNGIALPNALYMMQGIADVMSEEKAARKKWLYELLK